MAKRKKKKAAKKITRKERAAIVREAVEDGRRKTNTCLSLADSIVPIRCGVVFTTYLLRPIKGKRKPITSADKKHILAGLRTVKGGADRLSRNSLDSPVIDAAAKKVKSSATTLIRNIEKEKGTLSPNQILKFSQAATKVSSRVDALWSATRKECGGR